MPDRSQTIPSCQCPLSTGSRPRIIIALEWLYSESRSICGASGNILGMSWIMFVIYVASCYSSTSFQSMSSLSASPRATSSRLGQRSPPSSVNSSSELEDQRPFKVLASNKSFSPRRAPFSSNFLWHSPRINAKVESGMDAALHDR